MKKIAIMGSGNGENFEAIVKYLKSERSSVEMDITCISDKPDSDILKSAEKFNINHKYVPFEENAEFFKTCDFDLIVLTGYDKIIPEKVLELGKFVNIHPSLLPAFQENDAVVRAFSSGVKVSGVTVHWVAKETDGIQIIAQYPLLIGNLMHFDEFESAIKNLGNTLYPIVIEKILEDKVFDFSDLFGGCSSGCSNGGCGGCH